MGKISRRRASIQRWRALAWHLGQCRLPYGKFFLMGSTLAEGASQRRAHAPPTPHYDLAFSKAISLSGSLNDPLRK